jgi:MinD-like ATPase involved in chromosome partitioning or flagellar assembly
MFMRNTIFYVGGGKGGVGKSIVSIALVQFLIDRYGGDKTVHLIETDASNPDAGRIYKGKIPVTNVILDEDSKGWILMSRVVENASDTLFVINSAARSNLGIRKNGRNFTAALESGKITYDFVTLWPMNRYQDNSINACYIYLQARDNILLYGMLYATLFPLDICFSSSSRV